jgi:hypothetical protein
MSTGPSGHGGVPGYEFEVPRGPRHADGQDSLHQFGHAQAPPRPAPPRPASGRPGRWEPAEWQPTEWQSADGQRTEWQRTEWVPVHPAPTARPAADEAAPAGVVGGIFAVMRARNWVMGLAVPVLAAIAVGISVVVIAGGGGNGGTAPSALDAGFPPARVAVADFGGGTAASRVVLAAVAASAGTAVVAGGVAGGPAVWVSANGGSIWGRPLLAGPAALTRPGSGQLTGVAHGRAGWLAVGRTQAGTGALVIGSPDAKTWTVATGAAGLGPAAGSTAATATAGATASAVAAGPAGYVIVGRDSAVPARDSAAAWYSTGLTGWRAATLAGPPGTIMNAVTATGTGFAAVGASASGSGMAPAAWVSATGTSWQRVDVPVPPGAATSAALDYVAATGRDVAAVGTELAADGASTPFAEISANAGATWTPAALPLPARPLPADGMSESDTVTALTVAGGGFTATGTFDGVGGEDVVVWTLPATAIASTGAAGTGAPGTGAVWTAVAPQGTGLAVSGTRNAVTALTAEGATLTGVGFTATETAGGGSGAQQPTLWQSPIRP